VVLGVVDVLETVEQKVMLRSIGDIARSEGEDLADPESALDRTPQASRAPLNPKIAKPAPST
jgi:hypothetical protein